MKNGTAFYIPVLILLCSCSHYYYSPNTQNVPLFDKKGEIRGLFALGDKSKEIQAAVSITNHFGLVYNYYSIKSERKISGLISIYGDFSFIESDTGRA